MSKLGRLLLFNLATDADDPVLGFTTSWIRALAQHCDHIDVVTMRAGRLAVPENVSVYSVGKEHGWGELRRAVEFYRILFTVLRQHYDACFAHMQPLFAVMAAPLLRLLGVPLTLWYAHKSVSLKLRLAEKWVDHVVTASPESFRLSSSKVIVTGHGIDTSVFAPGAPRSIDEPFAILSVSRIAPVKQIEVLLDAARILAGRGVRFHLTIAGSAEPQHDDYFHRLQTLALDPVLVDPVTFLGSVPYEQVAELYRRADVMVNLSATGSIDKAVLEAMSCGTPVVTSNEAFCPMLSRWGERLLIPPDANTLAERIAQLAVTPPQERQALGLALREIVAREHSLERLASMLVNEIFLL